MYVIQIWISNQIKISELQSKHNYISNKVIIFRIQMKTKYGLYIQGALVPTNDCAESAVAAGIIGTTGK